MRRVPWTALLAVGVVAAVGVGVLSMSAVFRPPGAGATVGGAEACQGFTPLGQPGVIPLTTFTDPADRFTASPLHVTLAANCVGTFMEYTEGSAALASATGYSFGTDLKFEVAANEEKVRFDVTNDRLEANELAVGQGFDSSGNPICPAGWTGCTPTYVNAGGQIYSRPAAVKGHLGIFPKPYFDVTLTITTSDGQRLSQTVNSVQGVARWLRDDGTLAAKCSWVGNLGASSPPDPTGHVTVYDLAAKKWNLATLAEWDNYQRAWAAKPTQSVGTSGVLDNGWMSAVNSATYALRGSSATLGAGAAFTADGTGYEVPNTPRLVYPLLDCYFDGKLLAIVQPQGVPAVEFLPLAAPYHAGNPGTFTVRSRNTGAATGSFALGVSCNGAAITQAPLLFTVPPGGSVDKSVPFVLSNPGNYQCEAVLSETAAGASVTAAKATLALAVQVCQPSLTRVLGSEFLERCKADGSGWEQVLDCSKPVAETLTSEICVNPELAARLDSFITPFLVAENAGQTLTRPTPTPAPTGALYASVVAPTFDTTKRCDWSYNDKDGNFVEAKDGFKGFTAPVTTTITSKSPLAFDMAKGTWSCAGLNSPAATVSISTAAAGAAPPPPTPTPVPGTPPPAAPSAAPSGGAPQPTPGFEAVFAVAGLLAVAWLANRRKR